MRKYLINKINNLLSEWIDRLLDDMEMIELNEDILDEGDAIELISSSIYEWSTPYLIVVFVEVKLELALG